MCRSCLTAPPLRNGLKSDSSFDAVHEVVGVEVSQLGRAINIILVDLQNHVNNSNGELDAHVVQDLINEFRDELGV